MIDVILIHWITNNRFSSRMIRLWFAKKNFKKILWSENQSQERLIRSVLSSWISLFYQW